MIKLLKIDTTGNENSLKYPTNIHLFKRIAPKIKYLIEYGGECISAKDIDWVKTSKDFDGGNGHCIYNTEGTYTAAYNFEYMLVDLDFLIDFEWIETLSELCEEVAENFGIDWREKELEDYDK